MDSLLKDKEFELFQNLIFKSAGISITIAKKALVAGRLNKRLKHHQLATFSDYYKLITSSNGAEELQTCVDLLTTNETYFFREPKHFEFLRQQVLPHVSAGKTFRLWSGASSSGEEPYSLAMTLAERLGSTPWEIIGSDISTQILAKARAGHYPMARATNIEQSLLVKYCLKGTGSQAGTFLIDPSLRVRLKFMHINLNENLPNIGEFDVIFLRNVMIYFNQETKIKVVARMLPLLKVGGYFIVSHSESLNGINDYLKMVTPSIYRKP